jgi:cytidyltransferase-like protein
MKVGFTIGKFAPFHRGHEYLIDTAIKDMDEFYVVIYDTNDYDINMKEKWIKNRFSNVHILKAFNSPKEFGLDDNSINKQMKYLSNILKGISVTYFYSSEEYGYYVSKYLNINNVLIDKDRNKYNVSSSLIKNDIEKYKEYLNDEVYSDININH